jgi:hypothetical protein
MKVVQQSSLETTSLIFTFGQQCTRYCLLPLHDTCRLWMNLSIIILMLWSFYFDPQRKCMLVRLNRLLTNFCVHLIWNCKNPCSRWWWKTMVDLIWALLILSILSLKCESRSQLYFFIPFDNILEYIKLAKIVMIQVLVQWRMNKCLITWTSSNLE